MRKPNRAYILTASLSLAAAMAAQAQSGAYFNAVTNLHPVIYLPLTETVQPPVTKPAAANIGTLGSADNGTYSDGAFPGVRGALTGDPDTGGLFTAENGNPRVTAPYDVGYASPTSFTVELWINSPTNDPSSQCVVNCLDTGSSVTSGNRNGWLIYTDLGGTGVGNFNFRTYYGGGTATALNYVIPVPGGHIVSNTWYHVVVTYNGPTATAQGYINGQAAGSPATSTSSPTYSTSQFGPFTIGARSDSSFPYLGYADEVAFYPTVLGASDIASHYSAGISGSATAYKTAVLNDSPLLYFRLDDAAAPVATNYGSAGALANGYYETGVLPGSQPGPNLSGLGGASSLACQFNIGQSSDAGPSIPVLGATGLAVGTATSDPITVTAWIQTGLPNAFTTVLGKGDQAYRFNLDTAGSPHFNVGLNTELIGAASVADGNWHFWAGTWDGTNVVSFYIDGTLVGSSTGNASPNGNPAKALLLGTAPDYAGRNFNGNLCQVAVIPSALSGPAVAGLYFASGATGAPIISAQPQNAIAIISSNVTLSVTAEGYQPLSYQWYSNSVPVGANSSSFTITDGTTNANGEYYVVVTDSQTPTPAQSTSSTAIVAFVPGVAGNYFGAMLALQPLAYWPLNETNPTYGLATNVGSLLSTGNGIYSVNNVSFQASGALGSGDTAIVDSGAEPAAVVLPFNSGTSAALSSVPITIETWCDVSSITASYVFGDGSYDEFNGTPRTGVFLGVTSVGSFQLSTFENSGTNAGEIVSTPAGSVSSSWELLAVTVAPNPASNSLANGYIAILYTNGIEALSNACAFYPNTNTDFVLGNRNLGDGFPLFGEFDEVAIYHAALSSSTILSHYQAGASTSATAYSNLVQQSSPLVYWRLDDNISSVPPENEDSVATNYGFNGPIDNGYYQPPIEIGEPGAPNVFGFPSSTSAVFNHNFAGPFSGYVDIPFESALNITGPISIAAWIKAVPNDNRFQSFLGHSDSSYRMDVDQNMAVHFADDNGTGDLTGGTVNDGKWHFVVGTWNGSQEWLYIDGSPSANQAATGAVTPGSSDDFTIGVDPQYPTGRMFDGAVSEVALFTYALSAAQVKNLYYAAEIAPYITTSPIASILVPTGANTSISVVANGTPALSYKWSTNNGASLLTGADFSGTTSSTLSINGAQIQDAGSFVVVISNAFGSVTSSPTVFTVTAKPVLGAQLPATTYALIGNTLILSVGETGPGPITNAWYANGVLLSDGTLSSGAVISGSQTAFLTISNIQTANAGTYAFYATNLYGTTSTTGAVIVDLEPRIRDTGAYATSFANTPFGPSAFEPVVSNGVIQLTSASAGSGIDATAFWFSKPYYCAAFQAHFVFQDVNNNVGGVCFVIQNAPAGTNACGDCGNALGVGNWAPYTYNAITNSFEFEIDMASDAFGIDTNGYASPEDNNGGPTGYQFANPEFVLGDFGSFAPSAQDFWITYLGTNLTITYSNEVSGVTATFETSVISEYIPHAVGSNSAYIGFTAGTDVLNITGGEGYLYGSDTFSISNFSYTPIISLSIAKVGGSTALTWPTGVGGYALQTTGNLAAAWTTVPVPYTTNSSGMYQYTVPSGATKYYRLVTTP